jgi:hypothetical protein
MRLLQYLQEDYLDIIKIPQTKVWSSIYINPSYSDIIKLRKETNNNTLRFITNSTTKNMYIFNDDILHIYVIEKLKMRNTEKISMGVGHINGNKIEIDDLYISGYGTPEEIIDWDFTWCNRYFSNDIRQVIHRFMEEYS